MIVRRQLKQLITWLKGPRRKPIIIRGARQVGKSTLVREFAAAHALTLHEVNLERHKELRPAINSNDPEKILQEFQLVVNRGSISSPGSILFIDEIQSIPEALEALRYLAERYPDLPIVAAGSLLEFTLADHEYSMPVGRIEYLFMGPLVFEEFILAAGEDALLEYMNHFQMGKGEFSELAHTKLLDLYRLFCVVGGMPEAVDIYLSTRDFAATRRVHGSLVSTYRDDFAKYAKGSELARLERMLDFISVSLGEKIIYSRVDPDAKSSDLKRALFLLHKAQLVDLAYHSTATTFPLRAGANFKVFKPFYLDCGLISFINSGSKSIAEQLKGAHEGKLAEQFVAQHLIARADPISRPELYYWLREGKQSNAEVDFIITIGSAVFPVEVKSGSAGALRSLHQFVALRSTPLAVRFSQNRPELTELQYSLSHTGQQGKFKLLTLPLYMVGEVERLVVGHQDSAPFLL
jgi:predicted AAA+ superfamily ATPase